MVRKRTKLRHDLDALAKMVGYHAASLGGELQPTLTLEQFKALPYESKVQILRDPAPLARGKAGEAVMPVDRFAVLPVADKRALMTEWTGLDVR